MAAVKESEIGMSLPGNVPCYIEGKQGWGTPHTECVRPPGQSHLKLLWRVFYGGPTVLAAIAAVLFMDQPEQPLKLNRLLWAWPLALGASVAAVLFIRSIAVMLLKPPPDFLPLSVSTPIVDTVVAVSLAAFVYLATARHSLDPVREYRSIAVKVLVVSFMPDLALAIFHWLGGGWPEAVALMVMHIAVWAICIFVFPLATKSS